MIQWVKALLLGKPGDMAIILKNPGKGRRRELTSQSCPLVFNSALCTEWLRLRIIITTIIVINITVF